MALDEFELIQRYFSQLGPQHPSVLCGVGDDCALLSIPFGYELALSIDTLVAGIHFPEKNYSPYLLGHRALRVAASDLAAAGAAPLAFTLALTLPEVDEQWLAEFSRGLAEAALQFSLTLIGGDTTRGALSLSLQVHGLVSKGRMLTRRGAAVGDLVYISGDLGAASAALNFIDNADVKINSAEEVLIKKYWQPEPRLKLGVQLRNVASACIDVSDGLLADVGHIAQQSQVTIEIDIESVPIHPSVAVLFEKDRALQCALTGGDDYELCFTVPAKNVGQIKLIAEAAQCQLTCIGRVVAINPDVEQVRCLDRQGNAITFHRHGYQHFSKAMMSKNRDE
jgi:thiamine-monophosphate kinase